MLQAASQAILVADSSKYAAALLAKIAPLSAINKLVTDDLLPDKAITEIEAPGVEVIPLRQIAAQAVIH